MLRLEDVLINCNREYNIILRGRRRMNLLQLIAFFNLVNSHGYNGSIYYETDEVQGNYRTISNLYIDGEGRVILE